MHHVELYVSNLKSSEAFWGWFLAELGYSKYQKWDKGVSFKLDETYLVFVEVNEKYIDPPYHRCRVGLNHLAFHAESREQVDEITQKLLDKDHRILYQDRHPFAGGDEYYAVFFEDPDRMKVELVAPFSQEKN
ncbi:VOC family protein [Bacillus sp. 2205SS5-2]|uniref:VOC family protein n=1 Tax=Bacillus sp. 2205SS5-2 TaxID=3109031 RepID=UPI0030070F97